MSDNPIQVPIQYAVDTSKATPNLDALISRIRQSRNELETLASKTKTDPFSVLGTSARSTSTEVTRLRAALDSVDNSSIVKTTRDATAELKKLQTEAGKTETALADLSTPRVSLGGTADTVGQFERPLNQVAGSLSAFGGNSEIGNAIRLGSEVSGSIEAIGRLSDSLSELKVSGSGTALAMGAVGLAIAGISYIAKESKADLDKFIASQEAAIERQRRLNEELEGLSSEQDITRLQQANDERREQLEAEIAAIEKARDESTNARIQAVAESDVIRVATLDVFGTTSKGLDLLGVNTDNADAKLTELRTELETLTASSEQLGSSLALVSAQAKEAAAATTEQFNLNRRLLQIQTSGSSEDLEKLRQDAQLDIDAARQTITTQSQILRDLLLEQARETFPEADEMIQGLGIDDQIQALIDSIGMDGQELAPGIVALQESIQGMNNTIADASNVIDRSYTPALQAEIQLREIGTKALEESKKALEETTKAEEKRRDSLAKATGDYQDAVTSLEQFQRSIAEKTAERQRDAQRDSIRDDLRRQIDAAKQVEAEQERLSKLNQARVKANQDIQATERKLQAENVKAAAEYAKQRQQAERDLADSLQEAALDNDVNAFLSAKKAGEKELDRLDDEYQTQKREREAQARETTNNILRQLQEQERAELTQRANTITRSLQLEQQLARLEEQWRVQDAQRRLQLEQQASNDRLRLLQNEVIQARNIIRLLQNPVQRQTAVNQATNAIANAFQGVGNAFSFADGGIATRPTLAIVGDKPGYAEAMIPFRPSEGIGKAAARAGLGNVTLNLTQIIGEVASPKDIESARTEVFNAILEAKRLEYAEVV